MIKVVEVKTKKQIKEFVNFPLNLYKGNQNFVPPLYADELAIFKKNFQYNDQAESIFFLAYNEKNEVVGRISGILQHASNEKWNQKRVRFTRFDSINDSSVARALFDKLENWAVSKGMEEIVGPLGYSDLEREGLLIEGFDELSTFEEQYNYSYYQKLIEDLGYIKEVDWTERKIYLPKEIDPRIKHLSDHVKNKYNLKVAKVKSTNDFLKRYGDAFFDIIDKTYTDLYQTVPITKKVRKSSIASFKLIVNMKYAGVIVDENDNVVCFGLCFPSIAKAMQKSNGKLTPAAIIRVLKALKKPEILDLALIGVLPEYQRRGINAVILDFLMDILSDKNIKYAETNLNLETNSNIQNQWKNFDSVIHKRRRSFVKKLQN